MRLLPSPLWTPNGWFPLTDTEAWFDDLLAADLGGGGPTYATITYEGAGTLATTTSVAYPTPGGGILAGDLIVYWATSGTATAPSNPGGSGFTSAVTGTSGGSSPSFRIGYKVAAGGESGSVTITGTTQGQMFLFRGVDQTTPLDVAGTTFGSSTGTTAYNIPTLTTTVAGVALVYCGAANVGTGSMTPPTVPAAFTEVTDSIASSPNSSAGYLIWSGSGATGTINLVRSSSVRGAAGAIALRPALLSGGVTDLDVTPSTETDDVVALGRVKARTLTPATETDDVVALTGGLVGGLDVTLTPAVETDAAQAVGRVKSRTVTPSTEADAVVGVGRRKAKTVTPAAEADAAVVVGRAKRRTVTPSTSTGTAVTVGRRKSRTLTVVTETDVVVAVTRVKSRTLTPAVETDTVVPVSGGLVGGPTTVTITPATEGDTAPTLGRQKARTATASTETDAAVTVGRRKSRTLAVVTETDTVVTLARAKRRTVATATETDTAAVLGRVSARTVTPAVETDVAVGLGRRKSWTITPAAELDTAVVVTFPSDAPTSYRIAGAGPIHDLDGGQGTHALTGGAGRTLAGTAGTHQLGGGSPRRSLTGG